MLGSIDCDPAHKHASSPHSTSHVSDRINEVKYYQKHLLHNSMRRKKSNKTPRLTGHNNITSCIGDGIFVPVYKLCDITQIHSEDICSPAKTKFYVFGTDILGV